MSDGLPNNIEGNWYIDGTLITPTATQINTLVNAGYTTTATAAGTTTLTVASTWNQYFTGTTTQTVVLPVVSTLYLGQSFYIQNDSTGVVTVQSSGGNTIQAMDASSVLKVTCVSLSGTGVASWSAAYQVLPNFLSTVVAAGSAVSLTTGTDADVTSVSLPPGKWMVWGNVSSIPNSGVTASTYLSVWVSTTSATLPDASLYNLRDRSGVVNFNVGCLAPSRRFTLTATTTVYLSCQCGFTVSTMGACGGIYAQRG